MNKQERIKELEAEINKTQYNKATQHHIGLIKARIAKIKEEVETAKKGKGKSDGYVIRKSGDATVVLVGFPSVGKSTLLNSLTNAESKVAAYEFTTLTVIPGSLEYNHAKIQILDVPGIVQGAADGTGRGKEVLSAVRSADMVIILLDINQLHHYKIILEEVHKSGLRVNQEKPDVTIKKTSKGGVCISATVPLTIPKETIVGILGEFKLMNADILIRSPLSMEQLIDSIEGNKKYLPALLVINKIDMVSAQRLSEIKKQFPDAVFISADRRDNLEMVKQKIFEKLTFIRIFLKQPGKEADMKEPLILKRPHDLRHLCLKLHKDFVTKFRFARMWGTCVKYGGQKITKIDHPLSDECIVELHTR
ncbi:MAG: GTP-binding protein [Nanoarchaeota archaeon]|nr:GTP-binding protein [Nanoarchaeota archaeon]